MSQPDRIKQLINKLDTTQKDFAKSIGISASRLNNYLMGVRDIPLDISVIISKSTNCDLLWLLTGTGSPFINKYDRAREDKEDLINIPIYAEIAAGVGIEAEDVEPSEYIPVSKKHLDGHPGPFYAFKVKGSSMEPEMRSGDIVVAAGWDYTYDYNGHLCAFRSVDGLLVKRLFYDTTAECLYLIPINPTNPIIKYDENSPDLTLIGVIVALIRKYK